MADHLPRLHPTTALLCALVLICAAPSDARQPGPDPLCQIASDPTYGTQVENPIAVGGSPVYGAARQRRYLDALRGPEGQVIRYRRTGSAMTRDKEETVLDRYELTYDGLEKPLVLYLDWYHYIEPRAPAGLLCAAAFDLGLPPPDPFMGREQLTAYASSVASQPGGVPAPIPLGDDPAFGLALDHHRVLTRRLAPVAASIPLGSVLVFFPQTCDGRLVPATTIRLVSPQGQVLAADDTSSDAARISALALGAAAPPGSVTAWFRADPLQTGHRPYVEYDAPCSGTTRERTAAFTLTPAALRESPMPRRPAGDSSALPWVAVQAVIGADGQFHQARALGGPDVLVRSATEAVRTWRVTPAQANGAPLVTVVTLQVSFTAP